MNKRMIIDGFAGGGGASTGIEMALGRSVDIAINHDIEAIRMHEVNHPDTLHLTEDIFKVDLRKYVKDDTVELAWFSPDCRSFSKAKGSAPRSASVRMLPWSVFQHAKNVAPNVIIMENVEEIQQWGPLDDEGRPIKELAGTEYQRFVTAMKSLGYEFESRELVAADFGAPTTRKRWYAIFRRDGRPIVWPEKTHSKNGDGGLKKWLSCGDYIDFSDLGKSIYNRQKPLAEKTINRIEKGFTKYIVNNPNPYFVTDPKAYEYLEKYYGAECEEDKKLVSFLTKFYKSDCGQTLDVPMHTITTSMGHFGLVTAFLVKYYGRSCGQTVSDPIDTITCKDRFALASVVTDIDGEKYILKDAFLRMISPKEYSLLQGFPADYILDHDKDNKPYPKKEQVARIGNAVVPIMAKKLVEANCPYLRSEETITSGEEPPQQFRFA